MRLRSIFALAALCFLASGAAAQDYGRPGPYAALNGVIAVDTFDGTGSLDFDTGFGASGRFGYRFDPHIAAEAQLEYSGKFEEEDFFGGDLDVYALTYTLNGKWYFLTDEIQPYGLVGIGGESFDFDGPEESSFVVRLGGGLDFYMTEQIGILGEVVYNLSTGDLDDARYVSFGFGLFYRF